MARLTTSMKIGRGCLGLNGEFQTIAIHDQADALNHFLATHGIPLPKH